MRAFPELFKRKQDGERGATGDGSEGKFSKKGTDLEHEGVWRVHKDGGVFLGRGLQAELRVGGFGVVREGDGVGQLAVVQHLLVMLR